MASRVFWIEDERIHFHTLRDTSGWDNKEINLAAPKPFGQPNNVGGLRNVSSLEDVGEIARESAAETKRLFGIEPN